MEKIWLAPATDAVADTAITAAKKHKVIYAFRDDFADAAAT